MRTEDDFIYYEDADPMDVLNDPTFITNTNIDRKILQDAAAKVGVDIRFEKAYDCGGMLIPEDTAIHYNGQRPYLGDFWREVDKIRESDNEA